MAKIYTKGTWVDEVLSGAERYDILNSSGSALYEDAQINLSTAVATAGTPVTAAAMNNIEDGIDALDTLVDYGGLDEKTTLANADIFPIIDSAAGNAHKETLWSTIKSQLKTYLDTLYPPADGWMPDASTWTYASASTFTVSGNQTARFQKGTKLKFTQTTVKYAVVASSSYSSPNTTVTIIVNTDYTIANAAISATYYSYIESPQGWPDWFNYTPTYSASGSMSYTSVTSEIARYRVQAQAVTVQVRAYGTTGGTASYALYATLPIGAAISGTCYPPGYGSTYDNSTNLAAIVFITADKLEIRRYDNGNYGLGTLRWMVVAGKYKMA